MTRLIGESKMCPQEVCHLVLGLLMVQCPHTFVKINIGKRSFQLDLDEQNNRNIVYENNEWYISIDAGPDYDVRNQRDRHHRKVTKREFWMHIHTDSILICGKIQVNSFFKFTCLMTWPWKKMEKKVLIHMEKGKTRFVSTGWNVYVFCLSTSHFQSCRSKIHWVLK